MSQNKTANPPVAREKNNTKAKKVVTTGQKSNKSGNNYSQGMIPANSGSTRRFLSVNILFAGAVFMLALANVSLVVNALTPKTHIIAATEDGKLIRPVPLPQAFVTESRVLGFVDECLRASFAHDFENYRRTFNSALPCYTSLGGKEFAKAIDPLLLDIREKRIVMSVTSEPPVLVRGPHVINGRAVWEVQSVITLYFQGTKEKFPPQRRLATVTVVRVPIEESPRGVAINAIQLAPYTR